MATYGYVIEYTLMNEALTTRANDILIKLKLDDKREAIRELEAESMKQDFWADSQAAAKKMKMLSVLQNELEEGERLALLMDSGDEVCAVVHGEVWLLRNHCFQVRKEGVAILAPNGVYPNTVILNQAGCHVILGT